MPFLRRLAFAPVVLVAVTFVTYGVPRILRPDRYEGENFITGVAGDVNRALLHLDFGYSVILPGGPPVHDLWADGLIWDLWLLTGGLLVGAAGGIAARYGLNPLMVRFLFVVAGLFYGLGVLLYVGLWIALPSE